MKILANEFVVPFRDGWQSHASHLQVLNDGSVFCVYFYGSAEGASDVCIYGSLRTPDGLWGDPVRLSDEDGVAHWNPVLFRRDDGAVMLFYKVGATIADWYTLCRVSYDECRTWSDPAELVPGDRSGGRGPVRNRPIRLRDGTLLAPGSTERGRWFCFFDRSEDGGVTWHRSRDLGVPVYEDGHGLIQPTLWESEDGVHALLRSSEERIFRTDSADGVQWCDPYPIDMPNNNSGIDTARLPDGRILLVCNPVPVNWGKRTPMSLFESRDDGRHFSLLTQLTTGAGKFAYPAVQYENGKLHITYTWNRKTIQYWCLTDL